MVLIIGLITGNVGKRPTTISMAPWRRGAHIFDCAAILWEEKIEDFESLRNNRAGLGISWESVRDEMKDWKDHDLLGF